MPYDFNLRKKLQLTMLRDPNTGTGGGGDPQDPQDPQPNIVDLQKVILQLQANQTKLEEDNKKLLSQNQDLFLQVTGTQEPKKKDDNLKEYKDYVGDDFFNKLSPKEQKLLIEILEGEDE